ncbi:ribonuclease J [Antricoccus suffuscus]|uniref:Ribonuclease J n=1 Tax=Antricoccus suffuscus TaxID=1629062 RepID=A0A2T1A4S6_9ACTN|nr:ribonuclease J [Antricoccus suffuscus]PRZ43605.1 ribonuclease J [Antricoccus suffuscus]
MSQSSGPNSAKPAAPPALPDGGLRIVALGGLGEIGRNMAVFEYAGRLLVVDCGVLFPEDEQPGIDLILPDWSAYDDRLDDIEAIVLTHGHEDHIGGVPFLLRDRGDIPIVGSRFTNALIAAKLREHRIKPKLQEVVEGDRVTFGPFELEFFAVNHSIPDAMAVAIRTGAGIVLHTGDFKMDQIPLDNRITDLAGFARLGFEGIDMLMSDSTNAEVPGFVTPESAIGPVLDGVIRDATQRVIVACFASHVHRVQQVLDAAHAHGRKVTYVGRSMVRNMGVATDLGILNVPPGLTVSIDEAAQMPPSKVVIISTGSQGEPLSALARMAARNHRQISIAPEDTVILASSLVPGNETAVFKVINGLNKIGAQVVHKEVALVHVSGHAPAGELLYLLNMTKPSNVMPVHGEWRHLRAHGRLAAKTGVPEQNIVLADDGDVIDLIDGQARITGQIEVGMVYVDGNVVGEVGEDALRDRRILGDEGFIACAVVVSTSNAMIVRPTHVTARGFADDPAVVQVAGPLVDAEVQRQLEDGVTDTHRLAQAARRVLGKWVADTHRRRPMIVPTVLEV